MSLELNTQGTITSLYRRVTRLYSAIPYRFMRSGHAMPTLHYFFEVTRRCNLRCKMCQYIQWLETTPTKVQADGELSTEEWRHVIDQTTPWSILTFTGGEVFVRKDFMQLFEHACSKRRVHFISNATMLTEERAKRCAELAPKRLGGKGFNFAGTSIDGTREVHDVIRAQRGAFDKSMRGMQALARHRDELGKKCPIIHINTVILKDNLHVLPDMPQVAKDAGAEVLNLLTEMRSHDIQELGHVDPGSFGRDDINNPVIPREELDAALRDTLANAQKLGIEVRLPRMPYEDVLQHYEGGYELSKFECRAVWTNLYVGAKGGVYPCFINKVGNVREHSLKELWNSSQMRAFRRRRRDSGFAVCRGCCELEYKGPIPKGAQAPSPEKAGCGACANGEAATSGEERLVAK
jgi:MoaA/NifB/PqqE/SkfB family radical SAM enzyme